jgi:hypothetical protein
MEIGDIVTIGGRQLRVSGVDPTSVDPRLLYLEDARTGARIAVALGELTRSASQSDPLRYLVEQKTQPAD